MTDATSLIHSAHAADAALTSEWPAVVETSPEVMRGCLATPEDQARYILAGRGTITVVSRVSGARFTYRVGRPADREGTCKRCNGSGLWQGRRGYPCRTCEGTGEQHKTGAAPEILFVSLLTGADNTSDYSYLGNIRTTPHPRYEHGRKSRMAPTAPGAAAAAWYLGRLFAGAPVDQCEVWHEGRCARCGRTLSVPSSISLGLGPECAERLGL